MGPLHGGSLVWGPRCVADWQLKRDASNISLTLSQKMKLDSSQQSLSPSMQGRYKCKKCNEYVKEDHVCKADVIATIGSTHNDVNDLSQSTRLT